MRPISAEGDGPSAENEGNLVEAQIPAVAATDDTLAVAESIASESRQGATYDLSEAVSVAHDQYTHVDGQSPPSLSLQEVDATFGQVSVPLASETPPSTVPGGRPMDAQVVLRGYLDLVSPTRLAGWALREVEGVEHPLPHVRIMTHSGLVVAEGVASEFRSDLQEAGLGSGWSGFDLPAAIPGTDGPTTLVLEVKNDSEWTVVARHEIAAEQATSLRPVSLLEAYAEAGDCSLPVGREGLRLGSGLWLEADNGIADHVLATFELVNGTSAHAPDDSLRALRIETAETLTGRIDIRFKVADHGSLVHGGWLRVRVCGRSQQASDVQLSLIEHRGSLDLGDFRIRGHAWSTLNVRVPAHHCGTELTDASVDGLWLELSLDAAATVDVLAPELIPADGAAFECANVADQSGILEVADRWPPSGEPFSVVIPFFGNAAYTAATAASVLIASWGTPEVVLVDDGSPHAGSVSRLLHDVGGPVRMMRSDVNRGYTASVNAGVRAASHETVVILNNDARVTPGWDVPLREALADEDVFAAGPLSNAASYQSVPELHREGEWAVNVFPPTVSPTKLASALRAEFRRRVVPLAVLNGFCYAVRRTRFLELGGLDEGAFPTGYGEEVDLMLRARAAGFLNVVAPASFVYHYKSITLRKDRAALSRRGMDVVRMRWDRRLTIAVEEMDNDPAFDQVRCAVADILARLSREGSDG